MLKIRLSKTGKRNAPSYRIAVMPEKYPRDGKALEVLGHFNPSVKPPTFSLNEARLKYWLSRGAQMTGAVKELTEGKYRFKPYRPKALEAAKRAGTAEVQKPEGVKEKGMDEDKEGTKPDEKAA